MRIQLIPAQEKEVTNMAEKSTTDKAIEEMLSGNAETTEEATKETESTTTEASAEDTATEESAQTEENAGTDWKAEARKWESRSKENKEKADKADQLTAKVDELTAALNEATNKVANSDLEVTRWKVAAKHGVSEEDVALFLTATDEETLNKQAERLSQTSHRAPKPDAAQGNRSGQGEGLTPKQKGAASLASLFE